MLLFEGIDGVGKTTASLAARDLMPGWSYRHQSEPSAVGGPWRQAQLLLADAHPRMLVDRLHLSEFAYGMATRGECRLGLREWRLIELAFLCRNTSVIWMTDQLEAVKERWDAGREMYKFDVMREVSRFYPCVFGEQGDDWLRTHLPWSQFTLPEWLSRLPELAPIFMERARAAALLPPPSVGIGAVRAEFVVLGDCGAPGAPALAPGKAFSDVDLPFARGPVADWLWRAVDELGVEWWKGYYTNASGWGAEEFGGLIAALGVRRPRVLVCLGDRAAHLANVAQVSGWLTGVRVARVPHPAHGGRGDHRRFLAWRAALATALAPWCSDGAVVRATASAMADARDDWDLRDSEEEWREQQRVGGG